MIIVFLWAFLVSLEMGRKDKEILLAFGPFLAFANALIKNPHFFPVFADWRNSSIQQYLL